ncbi:MULTISPECIES: type II toxin-antitoxin system PemK/MazF family toxin [Bacillaceae]|nr:MULTISPECIES: type II toxin-antitoxin system PemK/MazF family toxin [Bacillaceae]
MRFGIMYKQGDIVLIPVPFTDLTSRKQRPVLIISNDSYNNFTEDIIVVAITSKLKDLDYSVIIDSADLTEGILKITSSIRADKVYTLAKNIVVKKFGQVKPEILEDVRTKINVLINNLE